MFSYNKISKVTKVYSTFVTFVVFITYSFFACADEFKIATIQMLMIQKNSLALQHIYTQGNSMSQNLDLIIAQIRDASEEHWKSFNSDMASLNEKQKEEAITEYRVWTELAERVIANRRTEIEVHVLRATEYVRNYLQTEVIPNYAKENNINMIMRTDQLVYWQDNQDVTDSVLAILNKEIAERDIGLKPLEYAEVAASIDKQILELKNKDGKEVQVIGDE